MCIYIYTSGRLGGVMFSPLTWNARDVGSIPALGAIFSIFITPTTYINIYTIHILHIVDLYSYIYI